jgi:hypothetical protein
MSSPLLSLGLLDTKVRLGTWFFTKLLPVVGSKVKHFVEDPTGSVSRIGDLIVWNGQSGQKVLAGIESLHEKQDRIESVVRNIETAQIGIADSLGTLTSLSMLSLGVTSLSAGFMMWRLNALNERLKKIGSMVSDILALLTAEQQAHLLRALSNLAKYEHERAEDYLKHAEQDSSFAVHVYRGLVIREIDNERRLSALSQFGRYYFLALLAQVRSLVLQNNKSIMAINLLVDEDKTLNSLAQTVFDAVMGEHPQVYLAPCFGPAHVTIDLLAEVYQQARFAGVNTNVEANDSGQMFEHFRPHLRDARVRRPMFGSRSRVEEELLLKLKYLMACLEEVNRLRALKLRIEQANENRKSAQELEEEVRQMCASARREAQNDGIFAYTFG